MTLLLPVPGGDPRLPHQDTRVPCLPDLQGQDVPTEPLHKPLRKGLFSLQKGKGRKRKSLCHGLVR